MSDSLLQGGWEKKEIEKKTREQERSMGKFSVIVSWIPFFGHEWLLQEEVKGGMMAGGVHGGWRRATAELITH